MINIIEEAKKLQEDIVCWRRYLHQIPEVGLDLPKTAAYVAEKLGLPTNPYKSVEILAFKDKFREFLRENNCAKPEKPEIPGYFNNL